MPPGEGSVWVFLGMGSTEEEGEAHRGHGGTRRWRRTGANARRRGVVARGRGLCRAMPPDRSTVRVFLVMGGPDPPIAKHPSHWNYFIILQPTPRRRQRREGPPNTAVARPEAHRIALPSVALRATSLLLRAKSPKIVPDQAGNPFPRTSQAIPTKGARKFTICSSTTNPNQQQALSPQGRGPARDPTAAAPSTPWSAELRVRYGPGRRLSGRSAG